jgi:hypothetical protein
MKEFRLTVEPTRSFTHPLAIEAEQLSRLLPEMQILALNPLGLGQRGRYFMNLHCRETQNEEIINGVLNALQEIGYSIVEATLVDIVNGAIEGFVMGGLSGLGVSVKSKDPSLTVAISCLGMAVGAWFGRNITWEKATYGLRWDPTSGWHFIPITTQIWPSSGQFFSPIRSLRS